MALRLLVQNILNVSDLDKLKLSQLKRFKSGLHTRFSLAGRITVRLFL